MASQGAMSDYLANMLLDASMNDGAFTIPTNVYLALTTVAPTASMHPGQLTEPPTVTVTPRWDNYARKQLPPGEFSAASARAKSNSNAQSFGTATTTGGNISVVGWAIVDVAAGGVSTDHVLHFGDTDGTIVVQNGNPVQIPAGQLKLGIATSKGTPP